MCVATDTWGLLRPSQRQPECGPAGAAARKQELNCERVVFFWWAVWVAAVVCLATSTVAACVFSLFEFSHWVVRNWPPIVCWWLRERELSSSSVLEWCHSQTVSHWSWDMVCHDALPRHLRVKAHQKKKKTQSTFFCQLSASTRRTQAQKKGPREETAQSASLKSEFTEEKLMECSRTAGRPMW